MPIVVPVRLAIPVSVVVPVVLDEVALRRREPSWGLDVFGVRPPRDHCPTIHFGHHAGSGIHAVELGQGRVPGVGIALGPLQVGAVPVKVQGALLEELLATPQTLTGLSLPDRWPPLGATPGGSEPHRGSHSGRGGAGLVGVLAGPTHPGWASLGLLRVGAERAVDD